MGSLATFFITFDVNTRTVRILVLFLAVLYISLTVGCQKQENKIKTAADPTILIPNCPLQQVFYQPVRSVGPAGSIVTL